MIKLLVLLAAAAVQPQSSASDQVVAMRQVRDQAEAAWQADKLPPLFATHRALMAKALDPAFLQARQDYPRYECNQMEVLRESYESFADQPIDKRSSAAWVKALEAEYTAIYAIDDACNKRYVRAEFIDRNSSFPEKLTETVNGIIDGPMRLIENRQVLPANRLRMADVALNDAELMSQGISATDRAAFLKRIAAAGVGAPPALQQRLVKLSRIFARPGASASAPGAARLGAQRERDVDEQIRRYYGAMQDADKAICGRSGFAAARNRTETRFATILARMAPYRTKPAKTRADGGWERGAISFGETNDSKCGGNPLGPAGGLTEANEIVDRLEGIPLPQR